MSPFWPAALCMVGAYERMRSVFEEQKLDVRRTPDYALFLGIASAELATSKRGAGGYRRDLVRCARRLNVIARQGADFAHMALVLAAERARLQRRSARALQLYAAAEEAAFKQSYRHHAALILERRARLLLTLRRETEATTTLRRAIALYEEWGARAKARALEEHLRRLA
jgi:hypothetical protein